MKKRILSVLCAVVMLLTACTQPAQPGTDSGSGSGAESEQGSITVLATTYPVYLFASAVADGVEGVEVDRLDTGNISCLHDYTLSVGDMKKIEAADVIAINGVGLETFMSDALAAAKATVVDCSTGVQLLENLAHHHEEGDDHEHGHYDPHIWMNPDNAALMLQNLSDAMVKADPNHANKYISNTVAALSMMGSWKTLMKDSIEQNAGFIQGGLITFHDGFQYFAKAFDLPLLASIEEEAGSEASAKEINDITAMVKEKHIPIIFTESNGSDATAQAISRETGCAVGQLNMLMSGDTQELSGYLDGMMGNIAAIVNGFAGKEVIQNAD